MMKRKSNSLNKIKKSKIVRYSVGIDEVGRGPLAGPVFVAAAYMPKDLKIRNRELGKLADSKKLSPAAREKWFKYFKNQPEIKFTVAKVSSKVIDKINISHAANLAALRAYGRLVANRPSMQLGTSKSLSVKKSISRVAFSIHHVYLDGGLYLNSRKSQMANRQSVPAKTVVRGDEKITAIKIASIIAKVKRDALMNQLAKKYPQYGFEIHKGYGTRAHFAAIKKLGPSGIHRLTFLRFS